jgi:hypothetical protein
MKSESDTDDTAGDHWIILSERPSGGTPQMKPESISNVSGVASHASFGILLPSGEKLGGNLTRREVTDALVFMPHGSVIDPPIPEGNAVALNFLDALCEQSPEQHKAQ